VNLWMKRAIGAAALGGSLLALGAGAASAQEVSADASARLGRPTSAQVRVCADGRVLSGLLGSCNASSGTSATVRAGRDSDGIRARVRVPRAASADVSLGTRRSRPAGASAQASAATRPRTAAGDADASADTSPQARADATASLSRPRRLLDLRPLASLAGVGVLGSSPFTVVGDPASDSLLELGGLTLDDLTGEAPAGIGVLGSGPIASGNQVAVDAGDVSPSVPVTVCGNSAGVLGDGSASCGANQPAAPSGSSGDNSSGSGSGSTGVSAGTGGAASDSPLANLGSGNQVDAGVGDVSPSLPVTVCGNGVGLLGDAAGSCAADTSTAGTSAPPPGTTPGATPGSTDTDGITGTMGSTDTSGTQGFPGSTGTSGTQGFPGSTGTSGIPGTTAGLTPGTGGGPGDPVTASAPLRLVGAGALPFTGAFSGLLALVAAGLLATGVLIVRAARPATALANGRR
jgi:hypothetical protein